MSGCTPGPWRAVIRANQTGIRSVAIDMPQGSRSYVRAGLRGRHDEHDAANARLIASSPDYAEAASLMIASEQSGGDLWWKGFEMLKTAHAKAGFDFPSKEEAAEAAWNERPIERELLEALKRCASDLKAEIQAKYDGLRHPAMDRRLKRDMVTVEEAEAAIAKAEARNAP